MHVLSKDDSLLGAYYFRNGIAFDIEKIDTIRGSSTPGNVIEVRSYNGI